MRSLISLIFFPLFVFGQTYVFPVNYMLVEKSEFFVQKEMNQRETGNNRGFCEKYQKELALPLGSAYCYAGQFWCYEQASKQTGIKNPLPRTGLAVTIYYDARRLGKRSKGVKKHDFLVWRLVGTSFGHIERIKSVKRAGWVETYAFNVQNGSRIMKRNYRAPLGKKVFLGVVRVYE